MIYILFHLLPFLLGGILVFVVFSQIIAMMTNYDEDELMEERHLDGVQQRTDEEIRLLRAIGKPTTNGDYDPFQKSLLRELAALEKSNKAINDKSRSDLVRKQMHISDEEQAELDAGISWRKAVKK